MLWGMGVVALFGLVSWWVREPGSAPLSRAFGVLVFYGALFLASLGKIWLTAGRPAVTVGDEGLAYQPLHLFRPRKIRWQDVLAGAPKEGTRSYRLVFEKRPGLAKEFFLNLAVVTGSHELLAALGEHLIEAGLEPVEGEANSWRHPDWSEPA
jgi:hypothetical protein